jgi:hypothetical protein
MVTDPLTPVFGEDGVGTIITMNGRALLGQGLEFNPVTTESYISESGEQYKLVVGKQRRLYITPETLVFTDKGFKSAKDLHKSNIISKVQCLHVRCIVCHGWYHPIRPIWAYCGMQCSNTGRLKLARRSINAATIPLCVKEAWADLDLITRVRSVGGLEFARITKMESGHSIYANNILISSSHLL